MKYVIALILLLIAFVLIDISENVEKASLSEAQRQALIDQEAESKAQQARQAEARLAMLEALEQKRWPEVETADVPLWLALHLLDNKWLIVFILPFMLWFVAQKLERVRNGY